MKTSQDKIISLSDSAWVCEKTLKKMQALRQRKEYELFYGIPDDVILKRQRRQMQADKRVHAFIVVGRTQKMCYFDKEAKKAFKLDGYAPTWMEWKDFRFIRFARPMDL